MGKRSDGRYEQKITIDGKRVTFYGKTKNELALKIADYKNKIKIGRAFGEIADEWEEKHEQEISFNAMKPLKASKKRIMNVFEKKRIKEITPVQINNYMLLYIDKNKPAYKTAARELSVINMIFKYAIISGDVENNPAQYINIPSNLKKSKRNVPSNDDIKKIINSLNCTFGLFAYLLLYTGLRRGEALALKYEDIDFKNNTININKSVDFHNNKPSIKPPKTNAGSRTVPLLANLESVLSKNETGLLFHNGDGELLTYRKFKNLWDRYACESGVTCDRHTIRHGTATILFEAGISVKDAQSIMGHADVITTQNIYTHIRDSRVTSVTKNINKYISSDFIKSIEGNKTDDIIDDI